MGEYDTRFFEYYESTRVNVIAILNEIVDCYTYKKPTLVDRKDLDAVIHELKSENDTLRERVRTAEAESKASADLVKKLKAELESSAVTQTSTAKPDMKSKSPKPEPKASPKLERKFTKERQASELRYSTVATEPDVERRPQANGDKQSAQCRLLPNLTPKELQQPVTNVNSKILTLKQLKDFIEEVYDGKVAYDAVCAKEGKARETLEQYIFSHLRNKYGLNGIVAEYVHALVEALKVHAGKDNDITLFALVRLADSEERGGRGLPRHTEGDQADARGHHGEPHRGREPEVLARHCRRRAREAAEGQGVALRAGGRAQGDVPVRRAEAGRSDKRDTRGQQVPRAEQDVS